MVTVKIGNIEKEIDDVEANWINQQINRRREEKEPVCVRVNIKESIANISFATLDCPRGRGAKFRLNTTEEKILELWKKFKLDTKEFTGGNLVAFVEQLKKLMS